MQQVAWILQYIQFEMYINSWIKSNEDYIKMESTIQVCIISVQEACTTNYQILNCWQPKSL